MDRMSICFLAAFQGKRLLIGCFEKSSNISFIHGSINVGQLVIDGGNQASKRIIDTGGNLFRSNLSPIAIDVDRCILHGFLKE